jgi:hypothetical protein
MSGVRLTLVFTAAMAWSAAACFGQLYEEDFNADPSASWTVNDPGLSDIIADFFYDYSSIGVPAAPNGSGTRGLKLTANNSGGVFSGFSVSPTGESFTGDYRVSFDLWQNYVGPLGPGGSGSTQLSMSGVGTAGNVAVWPGSNPKESVMFAVTLDGGSASDYRAYSSVAPLSYPSGDPVYAAPAGVNNGNDPYYGGFGGGGAPAAQIVLFPGQTGSTDAGEVAFVWRRVTIEVIDDQATWFIDGLQIASVDLTTVTLGGSNILLGHSDTNNTSSTDPNDALLNVTLIDNVRVDALATAAEFEVEKDFTDGNPAEVEVTLSCNSGLPSMETAMVAEGAPATFVVTDFVSGELECSVTETVPAGYAVSYDDGSLAADECRFANVSDAAEETCQITNFPLAVAQEIPTLSGRSVVVMVLLLALMGWVALRRSA